MTVPPLAGRLVRLVAVVLLVASGTLLLLDLMPGNPAETAVGAGATEEQIAIVNRQMGLDRPFLERLGSWLTGLARGDLGTSLSTQQPATTAISESLPVTLELALLALVTSLTIAVPLAVYAGNRPGGWLDRSVTFLASSLLSVPGFLVAVLLLYAFAVLLEWFPVTGWVPLRESGSEHVRHATLPVLTVALPLSATFARVLRNDMVATLQENYILAAKARGLSQRRILFRHALRPSTFSLITVAGVQLGYLIGGTVIVESVFGLPGLGQLTIQAINARDYTMVQAIVVIVAVIYVALNAFVDLSYRSLDPRVRARS